MKKLLFIILLLVGCARVYLHNHGTIDAVTGEFDSQIDNSEACSMPDLSIHLTSGGSVLYNSSAMIAGFQFDVDGATVLGTSGGAAGDAGFSVSAGNNTVLGFSLSGKTIPAGCGELVNLSLNKSPSMLSQIIFSIENGESISIEYFSGE